MFGGRPAFYLPNSLGSRYLNFVFHHPNQVMTAFELEMTVQAEKGEVRAPNSIQERSDARARRDYRLELDRLQRLRAEAKEAGNQAESDRLGEDIKFYQEALAGGASDTGERARSNVRHAVAKVRAQLRKGGPAARALDEHLEANLSLGHECFYRQAGGQEWD